MKFLKVNPCQNIRRKMRVASRFCSCIRSNRTRHKLYIGELKMNLSIFKKLLGSFALVLVPALIAVAIGIFGLRSTRNQIDYMNDRTKVDKLGLQMRTQMAQAREVCNAVEITGAFTRLPEIHAFMDSVKEKSTMVIPFTQTDEQMNDAEEIGALSDRWLASIDSMFGVIKSTMNGRKVYSAKALDDPNVNRLYWEEVMTGRRMMAIAGSIASDARDRGNESRLSTISSISSAQTTSTMAVVISLIAGVVIAVFAARALSTRIVRLKNAAKEVAGGNTDISVEAVGRDEIAELTNAFNMVVESIRKSVAEVHEQMSVEQAVNIEVKKSQEEAEIAREYLSKSISKLLHEMEKFKNGNLTITLSAENDDEIGKLYVGFTEAVANIHATLKKVIESMESTASVSTQISSSTEELASGAEELSTQATEVSAAVEEMSRTIVENSRTAAKSAEMVSDNGRTALEGRGIVERTTNKMKEIAETVSRSAATIEKLGGSSEKIGGIAMVIDDIADQTNLLALNAAIEAARAGDQGRGFAVVADEVRKLAERTTVATKEIALMIRSVQEDTAEAVAAMNEGRKEAAEGIELSDKAKEALERIVKAAQGAVDTVNQIAAASEEQSTTSEQISRNVETISTVAREAATGVSEIARSSSDLSRLTNDLSSFLISNFRTGEESLVEVSRHSGKVLRISAKQ